MLFSKNGNSLHFSSRPYFWIGDTFESASWETLIVTDMPYCDNMWQYVLEWFKMHEVPPLWLWKYILRPKKVDSCSDVKLYLYKWFENPLCASLKKKKIGDIQSRFLCFCLVFVVRNKTKQPTTELFAVTVWWQMIFVLTSCSGLIVHLQQRLQLISNTPTLIAPV